MSKKTNRKKNAELKEKIIPEGSSQRTLEGVLSQLKSAVLAKILKDLKIPGRSKWTKKKDRIKILLPLITLEELKVLGYINDPIENQPVGFSRSPLEDSIPRACTANRQFLEEYGKRQRGAVMGVDVHRDTLVWSIATEDGIVNTGLVTGSKEGQEQLLQVCRSSDVRLVAMESTAELWLSFYWRLRDEGFAAIVANPVQTKATQGKKTDQFDANRIALAARDGRLRPSVACDREEFGLRKTMRYLAKQIHLKTSVKNRIRQILQKASSSKRVNNYLASERGKSIFREMVKCTSREEIAKIVKEAYMNKKGRTSCHERLEEYTTEIWECLQGLDQNHDRIRFTVLLSELFDHERNIAFLEQEGVKFANQHPEFLANLKLLLTIPDVSLRTALIILAEVVDIRYFATSKQLTRWAGLTPSTIQSGHRKRTTGRLYKGGNKYLRRACWVVANMSYAKRDKDGHPIGAFVFRLMKEKGKSWNTAVTAGARKLLALVHKLLTTREPFSFAKRSNSSSPEVVQKSQRNFERKHNVLMRVLKILTIEGALHSLLSSMERSWERSSAELKELKQLCKSLQLVEVAR